LNSPQGRLGKQLDSNYLGFMVLKPLPQTIVGRTCFKTYPDDGNRRHFPTLHKYSSNLFGLPLTVNSLAYQEQDKVVAACATSALWLPNTQRLQRGQSKRICLLIARLS